MDFLLTHESISAQITLEKAKIKRVIKNDKITFRTQRGTKIEKKDLAFDKEGRVISDAQIRTVNVGPKGKPFKKSRKVYAWSNGEIVLPFQRTTNIITNMRLTNGEQNEFLYDEYYIVLPKNDDQIPMLFMIALDISMKGPVSAKVVLEEGTYEHKLAIITAQMAPRGREFSLSIGTTTRRVLKKTIRAIPKVAKE